MTTATVVGSGGDHERQRSLSGRSPAEVVRSSGLPGPLAEVVLAVTGKTRLWNRERVSVARELCGHFLDGLDAGATPEELKGSFGDPRRTARLITRAKKRNRPWAWKAARDAFRGALGLLILATIWYGYQALRFYSGTPVITFNAISKMNEQSLAVPLAERAWPIYRDAWKALPKPLVNADSTYVDLEQGGNAADPALPAVLAHARSSKPQAAAFRLAAAKERSAFVVSGRKHIENREEALRGEEQQGEERSAFEASLQQLSVYHSAARTLSFDAVLAASEGRGSDAVADVRAIMVVARHAAETGTIESQSTGASILRLACETARRMASWPPASLSERELVEVMHVLTVYRASAAGAERIDTAASRLAFDDVLQRLYTDDGNGNGHLSAAYLDLEKEWPGRKNWTQGWGSPLLAALVADRKSMKDAYSRVMDAIEEQINRPLYERDTKAVEARFEQVRGGLLGSGGASLVGNLIGAELVLQRRLDAALMLRDATVAGIATEIYQRRNGRYPTCWDDLVPSLLPQAPSDRWTGSPLRYLADAGAVDPGHPLIYSAGPDKKDDGGTFVRNGRDDGWFSHDQPLWPNIDAISSSGGRGGGAAFGFGVWSWSDALWKR